MGAIDEYETKAVEVQPTPAITYQVPPSVTVEYDSGEDASLRISVQVYSAELDRDEMLEKARRGLAAALESQPTE